MIDWIQCNVLLTITGALRVILREKLHQELGFDQQGFGFAKCSPAIRHIKIILRYIKINPYNLLPLQTSSRITKSSNDIPCFHF